MGDWQRGVGAGPKERLGLKSCQREFVRGSTAGAVYVLTFEFVRTEN